MKLCTLAAAAFGSLLFAGPASAQNLPLEQVNALEGLFGKNAGARRSRRQGRVRERATSLATPWAATSAAPAPSTAIRCRPSCASPSAAAAPRPATKGRSVRGLAFQFTAAGGETLAERQRLGAGVLRRQTRAVRAPSCRCARPTPPPASPTRPSSRPSTMPTPRPCARPPTWPKRRCRPATAAVNYWSTNAFIATNAKGEKTTVRWQFEPVAGTLGLTDEQLKTMPDDFLADELRRRVAGAPGGLRPEVPDRRSRRPGGRPHAGLARERAAWCPCRPALRHAGGARRGRRVRSALTFNPTALPKGLDASSDPVLRARAAPYAVSLGRRVERNRRADLCIAGPLRARRLCSAPLVMSAMRGPGLPFVFAAVGPGGRLCRRAGGLHEFGGHRLSGGRGASAPHRRRPPRGSGHWAWAWASPAWA